MGRYRPPGRSRSSRRKAKKLQRLQEQQSRFSAPSVGRRQSFELGVHGARSREQRRLSRDFGFRVSGNTHESEHSVGFEPINRTSGERRGTVGARFLENQAPAYQEVKDFHRSHIGTGTKNDPDESGMNSRQYRDTQRSLLEEGDVSSAVQMNQLAYAFLLGFQKNRGSRENQIADDSYNLMIRNMNRLSYADGLSNITVPVDERQRKEMRLARIAATTGQWPINEIKEANKNLSRREPDEENEEKKE
ncbi:hypothetical protein MTo_03237 [Microcystis aeruginosa NIES-1211]|jgi:hypothetical protein|uniref:hypothetical protein n=1 Tax=Microcystis TaxID=1125 RepID=UPI00026228BF|nr:MULTISPECIES: hypothetical protein [Microcystis]GBL15918.1 hypothetical protein MTo_03237 [Microcystis aeruginosa NIES-1211]CCI31242.1 hypothetical protein MICAI_1810011 [Microcystis sp. T1-4]